MKIMLACGKHQYGDPKRGIGTEYAAFMPALKCIGHVVDHFETWNMSFYKDYSELNRALLAAVERKKPDVLLTVQRNYEIWTETLEIIRHRIDTATVSWTTDDSWKYRQVSRFIGPHYHAMTTTYPEMVRRYKADGIPNVLLTQWAADRDSLRAPKPADTCRYKVSFVGAAHGNRKERITELRNRGIHVECFGYGWENGSVSADDIPRIMRDSVVSLNFSNSHGKNQLKARVFEVTGAGGFLLTENADGIDTVFRIGKEMDVFNSMEELSEKIKYYTTESGERDSIAIAGYERTRNDHTYDQRLKAVLVFAVSCKEKWRKAQASKPPIDFEQADRLHRRNTWILSAIRRMLMVPCYIVYGEKRGIRAARRLVTEMSWRICKGHTYSSKGLPARMFPEQ